MAFDGSEGSAITLTEGRTMIATYQNSGSGAMTAHFFGKDILNTILAQDGCMGIRMYYAMDSKFTQKLVIVGATAEELDMTDGTIADYSRDCPDRCDSTSALLSS